MQRATAYSDTWEQSSGVTTTRTFLTPVNYRVSDGSWQPINTALSTSLGGYESTANSFSLRLPESLSAGVSLSINGQSIAFTPVGAATAPAAISGSTATYREALPATDLRYASESDGVQELATLKDGRAPQSISYEVSLSAGLTPRQVAGGAIAVTDQQGNVVYSIPAPSAAPESSPRDAHVLASKLTATPTGWTVTVDLSEPWLREALTSGAVLLDPTVKVTLSGSLCTLDEEHPTTSTCESNQPVVGFDATHKEHHALLLFNQTPAAQTRVLHATLALKVGSHSTANSKAVAVYPMSRAWTWKLSAGATWNEYETGHNWTTAGGDYLKPSENSDGVVNPTVGTANTTYFWYPTKLVQKWANTANAPNGEGYADYGFMVKDETDNSVSNLLEFEKNNSYLEVVSEATGEGSSPQYTYISEPLTDHSTLSVNVGSGNVMLSANDMEIPGVAGLDFHSTRVWNGYNSDPSPYSQWTDSNYSQNHAQVFADGTVAVENPEGGWLTFIHSTEHKFIRPSGIHAYLCEEGSPEPCNPADKFPTGEKYRLNYQDSGSYIFYNAEGIGNGLHNRFGDAIAAEYPSSTKAIYTDTHGHKVEEVLNTDHHITEIKDVTGARNTKYAYTGTGAAATLETYTDATGAKTKYTHEGGKGEPVKLTQITNPSGQVTKLAYNTKTQVTSIKRTTNELHTTGPTTQFIYYEVGEAPGKYCTSSQEATLVRDPDWTKPAKEETGEKFVLAPHETLYCTNVLEEVERTFDANGNETAASYDKFENRKSTTAPAREAAGKRGITSNVYDPTGQDEECQALTNSVITSCTTSLEEGYFTSQAFHEAVAPFQPSEVTSATNNTTSMCYSGTPACKAGGEAKTGALKLITQPKAKAHSSYEYEPNGNPSASIDYNENKTTYEYEALGNRSAVKPPAGSGLGKTTITYDTDNRPHTTTECLVFSGETCTSSETETLTYDKADRVTQAVYTGPGAEKTIKYIYTADGWLEERTDPAGTTKYKRDPIGRVTEETLPGSVSNGYTYDEASNLEAFTDAGGVTHYLYNGLNQLEKLYEPTGKCGEPDTKCTHFTYDKAGSLLKTTYASGAAMNYQREPLTGRVTAAEALGTKGETLLANSYEYDTIGKTQAPLIAKDTFTATLGPVTAETDYTYEELDRLKGAITKSATAEYKTCYVYQYDNVGNRVKEELSPGSNTCTAKTVFSVVNTGNQLQCRNTVSNKTCPESPPAKYTYDGAGNEKEIAGSETGKTSFSYNNLNQLKALTPPGETEQAATFLGAGQTLMTGLGTVGLQNSLLGITKQTNTAGTSYYARTPAGTMVDERLPTTNYNPVYDAQGDIVGLLNTGGELVQTIRYGPYGENATATAKEGKKEYEYSPTVDPFLFQGGYHTPGGAKGEGNIPNGLYHYGERYYDPTTGEWTQVDPVASEPPYTFAGDDPANNEDPSGESKYGPGLPCEHTHEGCYFEPKGYENPDWKQAVRLVKHAIISSPCKKAYSVLTTACKVLFYPSETAKRE